MRTLTHGFIGAIAALSLLIAGAGCDTSSGGTGTAGGGGLKGLGGSLSKLFGGKTGGATVGTPTGTNNGNPVGTNPGSNPGTNPGTDPGSGPGAAPAGSADCAGACSHATSCLRSACSALSAATDADLAPINDECASACNDGVSAEDVAQLAGMSCDQLYSALVNADPSIDTECSSGGGSSGEGSYQGEGSSYDYSGNTDSGYEDEGSSYDDSGNTDSGYDDYGYGEGM